MMSHLIKIYAVFVSGSYRVNPTEIVEFVNSVDLDFEPPHLDLSVCPLVFECSI